MKLKGVFIFFMSVIVVTLALGSCSKKDAITNLPPINDANNKVAGYSGKDFLAGNSFTTLKIEIQYMPGYKPDDATVNNLTSFLGSLVNKSGGISVSQTQIPPGGKGAYTINDIALIEQNNRIYFNSGSQLAVYVLVTDGNYNDPNVLGVAYRNTSLCLFGKKIFDNSGGVGQANRTKLLSTVAEHEFGHLLGLVDLGTAMQTDHKDLPHGNHCNVENCLMYYAAETTDLLGVLITGNIPSLDSQCINDLKANGGK